MKLASDGALMPSGGFSRYPGPSSGVARRLARYRSHDGLLVVSSLEQAHLPGSGEPPLVGPQWLVSVSRHGRGRDRPTDVEVRRVVDAFGMPAFDEDNHHPGVARHLWCPVDEQYRSACECKLTEITVVDADGYQWTTDSDGPCRGCEYAASFGLPCPLHP